MGSKNKRDANGLRLYVQVFAKGEREGEREEGRERRERETSVCVLCMCVCDKYSQVLFACVCAPDKPILPILSIPKQSKAKKDIQIILRNIDGLGHLDYHKKAQQLSGSRQCSSHPFHPCSLFCLLSLYLFLSISACLLIMSYLLRQMFATGDRFSCLPWSPMRRAETQKQVKRERGEVNGVGGGQQSGF